MQNEGEIIPTSSPFLRKGGWIFLAAIIIMLYAKVIRITTTFHKVKKVTQRTVYLSLNPSPGGEGLLST
jgi:hypothetical protein